MTKYQYKSTNKKDETILYEVESDQEIGVFPTYREAVRKGKFFSKGGGFFGFTPKFMTISVKEYL